MSRSKRKTRKVKVSLRMSNKEARSHANRDLRRKNKIAVRIKSESEELDESTNDLTLRDVSDPWDFPSDGLALYFEKRHENEEDIYRFPEYKLMRK